MYIVRPVYTYIYTLKKVYMYMYIVRPVYTYTYTFKKVYM